MNIILSQLNQLNVTLFFAFFSARFQIWAQKLPTLIRFFSFPSSLQVNSGTVPLFCPGSQPSQVVTNYCTISVSKISSTLSFSYRHLSYPFQKAQSPSSVHRNVPHFNTVIILAYRHKLKRNLCTDGLLLSNLSSLHPNIFLSTTFSNISKTFI